MGNNRHEMRNIKRLAAIVSEKFDRGQKMNDTDVAIMMAHNRMMEAQLRDQFQSMYMMLASAGGQISVPHHLQMDMPDSLEGWNIARIDDMENDITIISLLPSKKGEGPCK